MTRRPLGGIGARFALAALAAAAVAIVILAIGVLVVAARTFTDLMVLHGQSTAASQDMFDGSVVGVFAVAAVVAVLASGFLALLLAPRVAQPLREMSAAARRIANGDYGARIPRSGPDEIVSLADSFNRMAESLEEGERLRRELVANASHELRTPLTNLQGYLEALRDGVIPPERATLESLWEETERLVRLARSLDTLAEGDAAVATRSAGGGTVDAQPLEGARRPEDARGTARAPSETDLADAIRSATRLAEPSFRSAGVILGIDAPTTLPVRAEADDLAQILGNLLQNASRYTPEGGEVRVRAERRPGFAVVSVANSGPGIPAGDLPHVFERFYRVDKSRDRATGGAGIGLAIVRQLVEAAGGSVGAESNAGQTRFWFSLPA